MKYLASTSRRTTWLARWIVLPLVCLAAHVAPCVAESVVTACPDTAAACINNPVGASCLDRPQDELWLVSTRCIGCPQCDVSPTVSVNRLVEHAWERSDVSQLTTSAPDQKTITLIYVHGNRVDAGQAVRHGRFVYRKLAPYAPAEARLRFVIWSWPSDRIKGQLKDVRAKALRTNNDGYYLGWMLSQFPPDALLSVIGYSYGARITTGGLHVLGGGQVAGCRLGDTIARAPIRVTLLAAAVDRCWIQPSGAHRYALGQTDELLNLYNVCDPALRRFGAIEKCYDPVALGYTGTSTTSLGPDGDKVQQYNMCNSVGKSHEESRFFGSSWSLERMASNLFWHAD